MQADKILVMSLVIGIALRVPWIAAEQALIGHWDGEIKTIGSDQPFHVLFRYQQNLFSSSDAPALSAIIDIPQMGIRAAEAIQVRFKNPKVYFELLAGAGNLSVFEGELRNRYPGRRVEPADEISGTCTMGNTSRTFTLRRRKGQ